MLSIFERIALYILILIAIYIFVKTSELEFNGKKILKLKYRILLALFFPIILIIGLLLSSFIIAIALTIVFIIFLLPFLNKHKKIYFWRK